MGVTTMKFKKEMLLPGAEPFTNACTNGELIELVNQLYEQARPSNSPKDKYINRRAIIATAIVILLSKNKDLQIYGHTFAILFDYLKRFDKDCKKLQNDLEAGNEI